VTLILRRLPFFEEETTAAVAGEQVAVRAYQPIVWVSMSRREDGALPPGAVRFPAVLDTGNNHNFSIREEHLTRWAQFGLTALPRYGQITVGMHAIPLLIVRLWIHRNQPGERDLFAPGSPYRIDLHEGVAVYPHGVPNPARLPTLGLRALVRNGLDLRIDGKNRLISLRS
jgi:hypothetical protein